MKSVEWVNWKIDKRMSGRPLQQLEGYKMTHRSPLHPGEWDWQSETTGGKPTGETTNSIVSKYRGAGKWENGQREEGERMDLESIRAREERVVWRCVWTYFKWERRGRWGWKNEGKRDRRESAAAEHRIIFQEVMKKGLRRKWTVKGARCLN